MRHMRRIKEKLSKTEIILWVLVSMLDGRAGAKILSAYIGEYLRRRKQDPEYIKMQDLRTVLSRLKRNGLLSHAKNGVWTSTRKSNEIVKEIAKRNAYAEFKKRTGQRDTIIVFDVPEQEREKRDLLRIELLALGFEPLQKSVWIGGSPLPEEFIRAVHELGALPCIHIFTVKKYGTVLPKK